jgi:hypothetical protein
MFAAHHLFFDKTLPINSARAETEIFVFKTTARLKNKRTSMTMHGQRPVTNICHVPSPPNLIGLYFAKGNDVILILPFSVYLSVCVFPLEK